MRLLLIASLLVSGCGASAAGELATADTAVVVFATPAGSAHRSVKSKAVGMVSHLPKPPSNEPPEVAGRMASALDSVALTEQRKRDNERRARDIELEQSMKRSRDAFEAFGRSNVGLSPSMGSGSGIGLGGIGSVGTARGSGAGVSGIGAQGGRGTPRQGAASAKPKPAQSKAPPQAATSP